VPDYARRPRSCSGDVDAAVGYAVEAEGGERLTFGDGIILIKAATPAFTVWEELPPLVDTPLHVQRARRRAVPHPRRVPHAHRRVVPGAGRFLVITCPGGFDGFFRMLADADRAGTLGPKTYAEASSLYAVTWLS